MSLSDYRCVNAWYDWTIFMYSKWPNFTMRYLVKYLRGIFKTLFILLWLKYVWNLTKLETSILISTDPRQDHPRQDRPSTTLESIDPFRKDCQLAFTPSVTWVILYNYNFSVPNHDIFRNEVSFYSGGLFALHHYMFVLHFFISVVFRGKYFFFSKDHVCSPNFALTYFVNSVIIMIKKWIRQTILKYMLYMTIINISITL